MGPDATAIPLPTGWESQLYPGAQPVIVEQFSPTALTSGEIAICGILIAGFLLLVGLQLLAMFRRSR